MADPSRPYRIEIPALIDDAGLSVYAFRLYAHVKRVAGDTGTCYQSARTLAAACGMSVGQVGKARAELVAAGFVTQGVRPVRGGSVIELTVIDVWSENTDAYRKRSLGEQESVHPMNTLPESVHPMNTNLESVHHMNAGVHTVNERRSHEEEDLRGGDTAVSAPPPPAPAKKRSPRTDPNQAHRCAGVVAEVTGRRPNKVQSAAIAAQLPDTDAEAARWRLSVTEWCGRGWNGGNIIGMLERHMRAGAQTNGSTNATAQPIRPSAGRTGERAPVANRLDRAAPRSAAGDVGAMPEVLRPDPAAAGGRGPVEHAHLE